MNLNLELARSRVMRNERVMKRYKDGGLDIPKEISELQDQAQNYLQLALQAEGVVRARISDLSLSSAVTASERLELAWARYKQNQPDFEAPMLGVDSRHYLWSNVEMINEFFPQLFDYATITHYLVDDWFPPFEPKEGDLRWGIREEVYRWLEGHGATVQARPVLWPHEAVMPEWLRGKSFEELKIYAANHAKAMVEFWGDRITRWEVANEMHDWANVHNLNPGQITALIKVTADTIRKFQPEATLIINNTNIFGDYAGLETPYGGEAKRRTPYLFIKDLVEAGVDFDVIGLQIYESERDLSELVRWIERYESFGKELMLTEAGVPSYYEHEEPLQRGETEWSESAQAQWAENLFRVLAARPTFKVLCWYDLTDFRSFVHNGGVLTDDGYPKEVFSLLHGLKKEWQKAATSEE